MFPRIKPREAVLHTLNQRRFDMFTLPGLQHLLAEAVRTQGGHVVHGERLRRDLTGNINGRV